MSWTDAIHRYEPDDEGRCTSGWYNNFGEYVACRSTQRSSVLHDDPEADFRQHHDHGGGDCMCYEFCDIGYYGHMKNYIISCGRCPKCFRDLDDNLVCQEHGTQIEKECEVHG